MAKTRTAELTLLFRIERQDDDGWPWVVTLESVEPRGTGLDMRPPFLLPLPPLPYEPEPCGMCGPEGPTPGRRICDACAVEEHEAALGAEAMLHCCKKPIIFDPMPDDSRFVRPVDPEIIVNSEGMLRVVGHLECRHYSGVDGDEYAEQFVVREAAIKKEQNDDNRT